MTSKKLVVGLGNPGSCYQGTPHNVGFETIQRLVECNDWSLNRSLKYNSIYAKIKINDGEVYFILPQTYMNLSGESVLGFYRWLDLTLESVLVVYDDVDILRGNIKFSRGGSSAGHRGVNSIMHCLGDKNFNRCRIGVGRPQNENFPIEKYVLAKFSKEAKRDVDLAIDVAKDAVMCWIDSGIEDCMLKFNKKQKE